MLGGRGANSEIAKYVGDWVGTGWGWEVRFKRTRRQFAEQFAGAKAGSLPMGDAGEGVVMTLTVKHISRFYFTVDESGAVTGDGEITYDLYPNLCGVAALTHQVNEQINLMAKLPTIYKIAGEIGARSVERFHREWLAEEGKLAGMVNGLSQYAKGGESLYLSVQDRGAGKASRFVYNIGGKLYEDVDDVTAVAAAIVSNRCLAGNHLLVGGLTCVISGLPPIEKTVKGAGQIALEGALKVVFDRLKDATKGKLKNLNLQTQQEEAACSGAGPTTRAGTKVGPSTRGELASDIGSSAAKAGMEVATGSFPHGFLLSIPGVTQVQYNYKGLAEGPESRSFKIKGRLEGVGGGAKLYLEMDGDVQGGDKQLWVEYMVNYKKEKKPFPTWSPLLKEPGDVRGSGIERVLERKVVKSTKTFTDKVSGKEKSVEVPREVTVAQDVVMGTPFATFRQSGTQRNGVKVWHEYEYYWNAHKLTQPKK